MGGLTLCPYFSSLDVLCRAVDFQFVHLLVVSMVMTYILHTMKETLKALDSFLPTLPLVGVTGEKESHFGQLGPFSRLCGQTNLLQG